MPPQAPYGERLPAAPRERKPALALLAVLLILVGALGTTVLVMRSGQRVSAIKVTQRVAAGQHITSAQITEVLVAKDSELSYVLWDQRGLLTSTYYSTSAILPGTLLTGPMVSTSSGVAADQQVVGLSLKAGTFPPALREGDTVRVFVANKDVKQTPGAPATPPGTELTAAATVQRISKSDSGASSGLVLSLVVPGDKAALIALSSATGDIVLVQVPGPSGTA